MNSSLLLVHSSLLLHYKYSIVFVFFSHFAHFKCTCSLCIQTFSCWCSEVTTQKMRLLHYKIFVPILHLFYSIQHRKMSKKSLSMCEYFIQVPTRYLLLIRMAFHFFFFLSMLFPFFFSFSVSLIEFSVCLWWFPIVVVLCVLR